MILVDTSVWIDAFADRGSPAKTALERAMSESEVVVGDLVLAELLQGFREGPRLRLAEAAMKSLRIVTLCGPEIALVAASNYRLLRSVGVTVRGTIDIIIATWCIRHRAALLHNDPDFDAIENRLGLVVWR
jgi:predicted nucleic acid-binding protein